MMIFWYKFENLRTDYDDVNIVTLIKKLESTGYPVFLDSRFKNDFCCDALHLRLDL